MITIAKGAPMVQSKRLCRRALHTSSIYH